jgi:hypothetical protein
MGQLRFQDEVRPEQFCGFPTNPTRQRGRSSFGPRWRIGLVWTVRRRLLLVPERAESPQNAYASGAG